MFIAEFIIPNETRWPITVVQKGLWAVKGWIISLLEVGQISFLLSNMLVSSVCSMTKQIWWRPKRYNPGEVTCSDNLNQAYMYFEIVEHEGETFEEPKWFRNVKGKCDSLATTNGGRLSPTVMKITDRYLCCLALDPPRIESVSYSFSSFRNGGWLWVGVDFC